MSTATYDVGIEIKISNGEKELLETMLFGLNGDGGKILDKLKRINLSTLSLSLTWSEITLLFGFTGEKPNGDKGDPRNSLLEKILAEIPLK